MENRKNQYKRRESKLKLSQKLKKILEVVLDKKCEDVLIIDIRKFNHISDFFIVCSSDSSAQAEAVIYELKKLSKNKKRMKINSIESKPNTVWNVIDYGDVILHIFEKDWRKFYDLEGLWVDAKKYRVEPNGNIIEI